MRRFVSSGILRWRVWQKLSNYTTSNFISVRTSILTPLLTGTHLKPHHLSPTLAISNQRHLADRPILRIWGGKGRKFVVLRLSIRHRSRRRTRDLLLALRLKFYLQKNKIDIHINSFCALCRLHWHTTNTSAVVWRKCGARFVI